MTPLIQQQDTEKETTNGEENALIGGDEVENVQNVADAEADEIAETEETPEQMLSKANEYMSEGKRHMVCRNFQDAVTAFDSACDFFSRRYGELSVECAEPYFCYGKSLIELERVNQSIITLTNKGQGGEKPEDSDNENEPVDKNDEKPDENESVDKGDEKPQKTDTESGPADKESENGTEPANKIEEKPDKSDNESECDDEAEDEEEAEADEEEEAVDEEKKIVLAWQFLDLARVIYEKAHDETQDEHDRRRMLMRLSEIRVCLGEVCILDEKFDDAVCEFESAQKILREHFPEEDRRLAETYFQMGSASEYGGKFDVAKDNFKKAIQTLESRLEKLEILTSSQKSRDADVIVSRDGDRVVSRDDENAISRDVSASSSHETTKCDYDNETDELLKLVADMRQRLNDVIESEMERQKTMECLAEFIRKTETIPMNGQCTSASAAAASGEPVIPLLPADDVSHLVRKPIKRDSDTGLQHETEPKRVKIDLTNGKSPQPLTGTTNDAELRSTDHVTVKSSTVAPSTVETGGAEMVTHENGADVTGDQSSPPVEPVHQ